MEVSNVQVKILPDNGGNLRALADVLLSPGILIRGCYIMQGKTGVFVAMPRRLTREGKWFDVIVIENAELLAHISGAVLAEYERALTTCAR